MSDISDTEKLDALERIRIGLDFLNMFVDKKGKLNVTKMREKLEQYEARIAELESQVTTDNSAVIATLEKRVEELEAENKQLLERESLCDWGWG